MYIFATFKLSIGGWCYRGCVFYFAIIQQQVNLYIHFIAFKALRQHDISKTFFAFKGTSLKT